MVPKSITISLPHTSVHWAEGRTSLWEEPLPPFTVFQPQEMESLELTAEDGLARRRQQSGATCRALMGCVRPHWLLLRLDIVWYTRGPGTGQAQDLVRS